MKTVRQLINELKKFPPDLPVFVDITTYEDDDVNLRTAVPTQYTLPSNRKSFYTFDEKKNDSIRKLLVIKHRNIR